MTGPTDTEADAVLMGARSVQEAEPEAQGRLSLYADEEGGHGRVERRAV
jgi:hypothetical protein